MQKEKSSFILLFHSILTISANGCDVDTTCPEGQWCNMSVCQDYAGLGKSCGGFRLPSDMQECDPTIHQCYTPESCLIADIGGTCVEKDFKFLDGDCCWNDGMCASGICEVNPGDEKNSWAPSFCQPSPNDATTDLFHDCILDSDCSEDKYCQVKGMDTPNMCQDYIPLGGICNVRGNPGMCNPEIHFCFEPDYCRVADKGGFCVEKTKKIQNGVCCTNNDTCQSGLCGTENEEGLGPRICLASKNRNATTVPSDAECLENRDCAEDEWCAETGHAGGSSKRACRKYAALNETCGGYTTPENSQTCNPLIHKCYKPLSCIIPDLSGVCVDEDMGFKVGDCCQNDMDCDSGICAERMDETGTLRLLCQSQHEAEPESSVGEDKPGNMRQDVSFCTNNVNTYEDGEIIDLGSVCIDDISFTTNKKICKGGIFIDEEEIHSCPKEIASCFQCGMNAACFTTNISTNMIADSSKERSKTNNNCVEGSRFTENSENDQDTEIFATSSSSIKTHVFNDVVSFFIVTALLVLSFIA